jgi:hypothetical protein
MSVPNVFFSIHCLIVLCKYLWNKSPKSSWKRSCCSPVNTPLPHKFITGFAISNLWYFPLIFKVVIIPEWDAIVTSKTSVNKQLVCIIWTSSTTCKHCTSERKDYIQYSIRLSLESVGAMRSRCEAAQTSIDKLTLHICYCPSFIE